MATSLLLLAEGVAGIYFVATLPAARRRGIGYSITLEPLREARRMGYGVGVLQASNAGAPVYRKMGFLESCKMRSYVRMNRRHWGREAKTAGVSPMTQMTKEGRHGQGIERGASAEDTG